MDIDNIVNNMRDMVDDWREDDRDADLAVYATDAALRAIADMDRATPTPSPVLVVADDERAATVLGLPVVQVTDHNEDSVDAYVSVSTATLMAWCEYLMPRATWTADDTEVRGEIEMPYGYFTVTLRHWVGGLECAVGASLGSDMLRVETERPLWASKVSAAIRAVLAGAGVIVEHYRPTAADWADAAEWARTDDDGEG